MASQESAYHSPETPILERFRYEFRLVSDFWEAVIVDPQLALQVLFPKLHDMLMREEEEFCGGDAMLTPADIVCSLENITELLVDPDMPCMGVPTLQYDPFAHFGVDPIIDLIEVGLRLEDERKSNPSSY